MQNKNKNSPQNRINSSKFRLLTIVVLSIAVSKALLYGALFLFSSPDVHAATRRPITPAALISLTNQVRAQNNLPPLLSNQKLSNAARRKAYDILTRNYFAHTAPSGKPFYKWIKEESYRYRSAGENLAIAFDRPEDVMRAWVESPTHYGNIIDPFYQELGIAVAEGPFDGERTTVIVQMFGEPIKTLAEDAIPTPVAYAFSEEETFAPTPRSATRPLWFVIGNGSVNLAMIIFILWCAKNVLYTSKLKKFPLFRKLRVEL